MDAIKSTGKAKKSLSICKQDNYILYKSPSLLQKKLKPLIQLVLRVFSY